MSTMDAAASNLTIVVRLHFSRVPEALLSRVPFKAMPIHLRPRRRFLCEHFRALTFVVSSFRARVLKFCFTCHRSNDESRPSLCSSLGRQVNGRRFRGLS